MLFGNVQMLIQSNSPVPPELAQHKASKIKPGEQCIDITRYRQAPAGITHFRQDGEELIYNMCLQIALWVGKLARMLWCDRIEASALCKDVGYKSYLSSILSWPQLVAVMKSWYMHNNVFL
jgi:hypothetical protein